MCACVYEFNKLYTEHLIETIAKRKTEFLDQSVKLMKKNENKANKIVSSQFCMNDILLGTAYLYKHLN